MQKPGIPAQQMQRTGTRERAGRNGTLALLAKATGRGVVAAA